MYIYNILLNSVIRIVHVHFLQYIYSHALILCISLAFENPPSKAQTIVEVEHHLYRKDTARSYHIKNSSWKDTQISILWIHELQNENRQRTRMQHEVNIASGQVVKMKQAAMAAAAEFTWSNAALQYEAVFQELGVKDVLNGHLA